MAIRLAHSESFARSFSSSSFSILFLRYRLVFHFKQQKLKKKTKIVLSLVLAVGALLRNTPSAAPGLPFCALSVFHCFVCVFDSTFDAGAEHKPTKNIFALAWVPCFLTSHSLLTNVWNVKKYGANAGPSTRIKLDADHNLLSLTILSKIVWFVNNTLLSVTSFHHSDN